jgi:ABC-type antimicrobial peptide transport system permease subunit
VIQTLGGNFYMLEVTTQRNLYVKENLALMATFIFELILVGIVLVLACIGLFGIISFNVQRRTQEMGIRMALGARPGKLQIMILKESGILVLTGMVVGITLSANIHYLLKSHIMLSPDNLILDYAIACAILGLVTVVSSYMPARWASKVDPMEALRTE